MAVSKILRTDKRRALKITTHLRQVKQLLIAADLHMGQALKAMEEDEIVDLDLEEYRLHLQTFIDAISEHL